MLAGFGVLHLRRLLPVALGGVNERHLGQHVLTARDDLARLALLRTQPLAGGELHHVPVDAPELLHLRPLRRVWRVSGAAEAGELGRAHVRNRAGAAHHRHQRAHAALRTFKLAADRGGRPKVGAREVDAVQKDALLHPDQLRRGGLGVVARHLHVALLQQQRDHVQRHLQLPHLGRKAVAEQVRAQPHGLALRR